MRKFSTRRAWVCLFAGLGLLLVLAQRLDATSYTITTFADDTVVNGNCTLREAIRAAKTNLAVDACALGGIADTITLLSGTYPFSGEEMVSDPNSLTIQSQALNPFSVSIDLGNVGNFLYLGGGGSFVLDGLEIKNGTAAAPFFEGGAIEASSVSLEIRNFRFISNHALAGGAISYRSSGAKRLYVHNGTFQANSASGNTSSPSAGGAADVSVESGADALFHDVNFLGNSAASASPFAVEGGALRFATNSSGSEATCARCNFENNSAVSTASVGATGAFHSTSLAGSTTQLIDCRFVGNSATGNGTHLKAAAVQASSHAGSTLLLERLFVDFNGGVSGEPATYDIALAGAGGTVALYDSQLTFGATNGLEVTSDSPVALGHLTIADYPGTGAALVANAGQIQFQNSISVFNGNNLFSTGTVLQTTNFVGGNPLFLDRPNGNYHLSASSTAIGSGTNGAPSVRLADLDHRGRIVGAATDLGCYEFDGLFADDFEVRDTGSWSSTAP